MTFIGVARRETEPPTIATTAARGSVPVQHCTLLQTARPLAEIAVSLLRELFSTLSIGMLHRVLISQPKLIEQLRQAHASLSKIFPASSASYAILHLDEAQQSRTIHAGDCLIGRGIEPSLIQWQIKPHTLVNALHDVPITELAKNDVRNRLTRSFRAKEFIAPSTKTIQVDNTSLILATDGFWAELSEKEQSVFVAGHEIGITSACDDKSILCIEASGKVSKECLLPRENFYLRKTF